MRYRRIVDDELDELSSGLPAIALEGAKAVGKTWTARERVRTEFALDDPARREVLAADPERIVAARRPILIDEWQRLPVLWDVVRRAVDRDGRPGQFLLAGLATPLEQPTHSGAGRSATVRMRPLSFAERDVVPPTVSMRALLHGELRDLDGNSDVTLDAYVDEILRSGFPGMRDLPPRARDAQLDGYIARIAERDISDVGPSVRRPATLRRWMAAYAAATATTASWEAIRDATSAGHDESPHDRRPARIGTRSTDCGSLMTSTLGSLRPTTSAS